MTKTIILAIVQGLTEFLPISSSGHLVIANKFIGAGADVLLYSILHLGTVLSVLVYFFKDIIKAIKSIERARNIVVACFITGLIGLTGKSFFESLFDNYRLVLCALFINGIVMIIANMIMNKGEKEKVDLKDAVIMGLAQAAAIIPGISRSGSTISALLFRKVKREEAFRFSFVSAIPLIFAAFILEARHASVESFSADLVVTYIIGCAISFITGLCALRLLSYMIKKSRFDIFGWYCITISILLFCLS